MPGHPLFQGASGMKAVSRAVLLVAMLATAFLLLPAAGAADEGGATYTAPYEPGPQGGDQWNLVHVDEDEGRVLVGRAYPIYNPISCASGGGFVKLQVAHVVDGPLTEVSATFADAAVDAYTFVTLAVRTADGDWIAGSKERGPLLLDGELTAEVFGEIPQDDEHVIVQFGLEIASACPHANGGTVRFESITVR